TTPLYAFSGGTDGAFPSRMTFGPDGNLYGTTEVGGQGCDSTDSGEFNPGCGVVYRLRPASTPCHAALCPWVETVLYAFQGIDGDGSHPLSGLVFDRLGNMYGTTSHGGGGTCSGGCGTVFKLTPTANGWTETVIYRFTGGSDGAQPSAE